MSRVTIRPIRGDQFHVEGIDISSTPVSELKQSINKAKGDEFPAEKLKLIHLGQILDDKKTLSDYNFKENESFLVCMVSKPKKEKKAKTTAPAPAPATITPPAVPNNIAAPTPRIVPNTITQQAVNSAPAASGPVIGQETVDLISGMGFPESEARAALAAAYGNPERAVEFLTNPALMEAALARNNATPTGTSNNTADATGGNSDPASQFAAAMAEFRNTPQFAQIRAQLNQDPSQIEAILRSMAQYNRQLFHLLINNEQFLHQFLETLLEDGEESGSSDVSMTDAVGAGNASDDMLNAMGLTPEMMMQALEQIRQLPAAERQQMMQQYGMDPAALEGLLNMTAGRGGAGGAPRQDNRVRLTQEEVAAIDRLAELGFSRGACIEAYLACDKNEELAANYLFTNPPEEEEEMPPPPRSNNTQGGNSNNEGDGI